MRQSSFVLALAGALFACSEDPAPAGPPPPGCDLGSSGFTSTCYSDAAPDAQTSCATASGTWLPGGCPGGTDLVGICIGPEPGRVTYVYSSAFVFYATNDAAAACAGTFVPMGAQTSESCDFTAYIPMCADGTGTESDIVQGEWRCSMSGGTLIPGPCPTNGRSGTCSYADGSGIDVKERWYAGTTAVGAGCVDQGEVWTPN